MNNLLPATRDPRRTIGRDLVHLAQSRSLNQIGKDFKNKNGATFPAILLTTIDPRQHPNLKLHSLLLVFDADPNRYREDLAFPVETNSGIPLLSFPTQIKLNQGFFRQNNISAYFDREFMSPISVDEVLVGI